VESPAAPVTLRLVHPFPPARALAYGAGGALTLFLVLWWSIVSGQGFGWMDSGVESYVSSEMSPESRELWGAILSFPGDLIPLVVVLAAGSIACIRLKRIMNPLWMGGYTLVVVLLTSELKELVGRARPLEGGLDTFAFPSGHAARAILVYGLVFAFVIEAWHARARDGFVRPMPLWVLPGAAATWLTIAFIVGAGRIVEGSHWATDVLAGYAVGFVVLFSAMLYHGQMQRRIRTIPRRKAAPAPSGQPEHAPLEAKPR